MSRDECEALIKGQLGGMGALTLWPVFSIMVDALADAGAFGQCMGSEALLAKLDENFARHEAIKRAAIDKVRRAR